MALAYNGVVNWSFLYLTSNLPRSEEFQEIVNRV